MFFFGDASPSARLATSYPGLRLSWGSREDILPPPPKMKQGYTLPLPLPLLPTLPGAKSSYETIALRRQLNVLLSYSTSNFPSCSAAQQCQKKCARVSECSAVPTCLSINLSLTLFTPQPLPSSFLTVGTTRDLPSAAQANHKTRERVMSRQR